MLEYLKTGFHILGAGAHWRAAPCWFSHDHHGSYAGHVCPAKGRCGLCCQLRPLKGHVAVMLRHVAVIIPKNVSPEQNDGF